MLTLSLFIYMLDEVVVEMGVQRPALVIRECEGVIASSLQIKLGTTMQTKTSFVFSHLFSWVPLFIS